MHLLSLAFAAMLPLGPAPAQETFTFKLKGTGFTASGTLQANPNGNGTSTVVSGKGSMVGKGIPANQQGALVLVPNPAGEHYSYYKNSGINYDDQVDPDTPQEVDFYGLLFTLPNGNILNIFSIGPDEYVVLEVSGTTWVIYELAEFSLAP